MMKGSDYIGGKKALQNVVQLFLHATPIAPGSLQQTAALNIFPHDLKSLSDLFIDILVLVLQHVRKECGN